MICMYFFVLIKHASLPWVILHAMFTQYTIFLKEEQWLWTSTAPLQLTVVFDSHLCCIWSAMCSLHFYSSSKSIDSMKVMNESQYFVMSSCLLAGQVLILSMHCFRTSLCVCNIVQWFSRWSIVWLPCLQMHIVSSLSLKQWRYALVLPCPVSIAARFGVRLIFTLSLSCTVGKYCFVTAALAHVLHSSCHCCLASSAAL
jgi:hypothetical protein